MPKHKRARSTSSDGGSSYKQSDKDSDSDAEMAKMASATERRISTRKVIASSRDSTPTKMQPITTSGPLSLKSETPTFSKPGKLLAALNALDKDTRQTSPKRRKINSGAAQPQSAFASPSKSASGSPSKRKSPQKKKLVDARPIPEPKPESQWRTSDIPSDLQITKGNAQKLFHLTAEEVTNSGLTFMEEKRARGLAGTMHLYNMRAIERVAWRKHGSPEGYDAAILNARDLWVAKGKDQLTFPFVPRPFRSRRQTRCKSCNTQFPTPTHLLMDRCNPCRGVVAPPAMLYRDLAQDLMDMAEEEAYDEDAYDEVPEEGEYDEDHDFCGCKTCEAIAMFYRR
ncbi:hypothetical protein FRC19_000164 [Serendipita sp. 401]|nr:hypothetical protein FRC15_001421 [Serendipita sp. 397]KAG8804047.1 hypothetical protein FRC16_000916 [Serendipita sp. 398]KAG8828776.1 hypothetical protein FRC19_000164 [Serendipita sp. 401]KAG8876488.1 hypothetical protein FRC20_001388 [Serendipita sp. 405]